jgi:hypothetical protein
MPSLPIEKDFYSTPTKLPAVLDYYKEKHNIENLSNHCLSPKILWRVQSIKCKIHKGHAMVFQCKYFN